MLVVASRAPAATDSEDRFRQWLSEAGVRTDVTWVVVEREYEASRAGGHDRLATRLSTTVGDHVPDIKLAVLAQYSLVPPRRKPTGWFLCQCSADHQRAATALAATGLGIRAEA